MLVSCPSGGPSLLITLTVPDTALVQTVTPSVRTIENISLATKGEKVVVWTQPALVQLD